MRVNINDRVLAAARPLAVLAGVLMFVATAAFQPVRSHLNPPDPPVVKGAARAIIIVDPPGPGQGPKTSLNPGDPPVITH